MSRTQQADRLRPPSIFRPPATPATSNLIPSSSPAFATPAHPVRPYRPVPNTKASILPVLLPPATLRPLAFRTFTKKYSLTLTSSALQSLATFIGRHCGSGWREEGLAEHVLEEVAKTWKRLGGTVIVDGEGSQLKDILKVLEGNMSEGRVTQGRELSRHNSLVLLNDAEQSTLKARPTALDREDSQASLGMSSLEVGDEDVNESSDPRNWLKVIDAYEQPRLVYNFTRKHFDKETTKPSLLPPPSHKTQVFRNRYNLIHQRLLRNESFQTSSAESARVPSLQRTSSTMNTAQQSYKLTSIANLLGRNGSNHLLLGLLTLAPTGTLAISDLTGSISLDLTHAQTIPRDGAWFAPGMIVLVDGVYEAEDDLTSRALGGGGGIGGIIGGKFIGFSIGSPPCERRQVTLGVSGSNDRGDVSAGGGFGWVDFLGVGSERAIGSKMRKMEQRVFAPATIEDVGNGRGRIVVLGEINLDTPRTLQALKKIFGIYAAEPEGDSPMTFVLMGNFVQYAVMARGGSGKSVDYKEYFDSLATILAEYPTLLQSATFVFVPGDNDGWTSAYSSGAAVPIPRKPVPAMFTSRIKRAFATANAEAEKESGKKTDGEAIWTTNPSRLSLFGPTHEIVLFRDDISSRLRRSSIRFSTSDPSQEAEEDAMSLPVDLDPSEMQVDEALSPGDAQPKSSSHGITSTPMLSDDVRFARKLVKTILDQSYLSPFRIATRPILWDYDTALHLYPLPTAMVLADSEAPAFCVTYEGCHVMNPGPIVAPGRKGVGKWVEYDIMKKAGSVKECLY